MHAQAPKLNIMMRIHVLLINNTNITLINEIRIGAPWLCLLLKLHIWLMRCVSSQKMDFWRPGERALLYKKDNLSWLYPNVWIYVCDCFTVLHPEVRLICSNETSCLHLSRSVAWRGFSHRSERLDIHPHLIIALMIKCETFGYVSLVKSQ